MKWSQSHIKETIYMSMFLMLITGREHIQLQLFPRRDEKDPTFRGLVTQSQLTQERCLKVWYKCFIRGNRSVLDRDEGSFAFIPLSRCREGGLYGPGWSAPWRKEPWECWAR